MRLVFVAAAVVGLLAGLAVVGLKAITGGSSARPAAVVDAGDPDETAAAFADAWRNGDFVRLHATLTNESRVRYPLDTLEAAYAMLEREATVESLSVDVVSADSRAASLRVRLTTAYFADLEYAITVPFVREDGVYRVTWSPTLLFPGLKDGVRLRSDIEVPRRGAILDRSGSPLAVTQEIRMLGLNRSVVRDRAAVTAAIVELGFTAEQADVAFTSRLASNQRVPIGPIPDAQTEAAFAALARVDGLLVYFESQRVHPLGAAAAHVVGYTRELTANEISGPIGRGHRAGDRVGAIGLEAAFEEELAGSTGAELRLLEADSGTSRVVASRPFVPGSDVTTTLDSPTLGIAHARLGGRAGAVVVLDPRTNAVLAINSSPSFDPDAFERNDAATLDAITRASNGPLANRATTGLYSGGSTFKLITGAAGLLYGVAVPATRYECGAVWSGVQPSRRNWEGGQGQLTIAEALMRSCNPVFYEIGLRLYNDHDGALAATARLFGFGAPTGLAELPEEDGLVPDAVWKRANRNEPWYPGDEVNLAIGQGDLLITPLQLANAYGAFLGNELRTPVIVAGAAAQSKGSLGLTADQSAHLKNGLQLVTGANGTASAAFWNAGYRDFGGKSGTAEDAGEQQHVLFVAFTPRTEPRAVVAVVLDEGQSGSQEAGPIARDVALVAAR